ncbi:sensor histidine kinase KdpD [Paenibacillus sp. J22TS3]|uniref:sensor histidine kinase n=1 Tax=Paenibacillus sp. J22TS3 TaxID=2807192 RepID=UPI001BCE2035|nr:HAMP domain-containing sensor histidine kinase [Paenibacillus sp. J22TS3]
MNVRRRLVFRFIGQLVVVGLVLMTIAVAASLWILEELNHLESDREFQEAGLMRLIDTSVQDEKGVHFDEGLLKKIRDSGGWLQLLDDRGNVTQSYYTPADVPRKYASGEIMSYWTETMSFPYSLGLYVDEKDGVTYTLLYGRPKNKADRSLERLLRAGMKQNGDKIELPEADQKQLEKEHDWIQLLDSNGAEIASFNKPNGVPGTYKLSELVLRSRYGYRYNAELLFYYDQSKGNTWILNKPLTGTKPGETPSMFPEIRIILTGLGAIAVASLVTLVLFSFWYGHRFGSPMMHMMQWLSKLGEGVYEEPLDRQGLPRSQDRKGKQRRRYRVYKDVMGSLRRLTDTLRTNEALRSKQETIREEWIAGVTHDLKTPLSTIKGYAHMLESDSLHWTDEEIREFAMIIRQKSAYMDDLINDLGLTYRLKNEASPPKRERVELNAYLEDVVEQIRCYPAYDEDQVHFVPADRPVEAEIYHPWFRRILDNLIANALLHNEPQTVATVILGDLAESTYSVTIRDNGEGMDETTASLLFERYYRGTNTERRSEGTGLGMAVTRALVHALGGTIEVKTRVGEGTQIKLEFPYV